MKSLKGISLFVSTFLIVGFLISSSLSAAENTIKIASGTATRFAASGVIVFVKEALEQATYGKIKAEIYPGTLGSDKMILEKIASGDIQAGTGTPMVAMNMNPKMGVVCLPFVLETREKLYEFYRSDLGKEMLNCLADKGLTGIDHVPWGPIGYLTTKPVAKFTDMKGMRFRTAESPIWIDTFKALGASPVMVPFFDAYSALQRGVIEGTDNPPETVEAVKWYEVAKNYTPLNVFFSQNIFFVNTKWFKSQSKDFQEMFVEVVKKSCALSRTIEEFHQDKAINMMVQEHGLNVINLPPEEVDKFKKATKSVVTKYIKEIGEDYAKKVLTLSGYKY